MISFLQSYLDAIDNSLLSYYSYGLPLRGHTQVGAVVVIEIARPLLAAGNNINPATRINADTAVVMRTLDDFFINLAVC